MSRKFRFFIPSALFALFFLFLLLPRTVRADETVYVDYVRTSEISSGISLKLTQPTTTIFVNDTKTIRSIDAGSNDVIIKSSNKSFTLSIINTGTGSGDYGIKCKDLTLNNVSVQMMTGRCVSSTGTLTVDKDSKLTATGINGALYAYWFNLAGEVSALASVKGDAINSFKNIGIRKGAKIQAYAGTSTTYANENAGDAVYTKYGWIDMEGGYLDARGYHAIYAPSGASYIRLDGAVNARGVKKRSTGSYACAICADSASVTINGIVTVQDGSCGVYSGLLIRVNSTGRLTSKATKYGMKSDGGVIIQGWTISTGTYNDGIYAKDYLKIKGTVQTQGGDDAVYCKNASIDVDPAYRSYLPAGAQPEDNNPSRRFVDSIGKPLKVFQAYPFVLGGTVTVTDTALYGGDTVSVTGSDLNYGGGYLKYQWYKSKDKANWTAIAGATRSYYDTKYLGSASDIGYYLRLEVTHKVYLGSVTSNVTKIVQDNTPVFNSQPSDSSDYLGSEQTFTADASPRKSLAWSINDGSTTYNWSTIEKHAIVSGKNSTTLTIIPFDYWLSGKKVVCEALGRGAKGQWAYSSPATIRIEDNIITHPSDASAKTGSVTKFTANAYNASSYIWCIYDASDPYGDVWTWAEVRKHADITGENSSSISITPKDTWLDGKLIGCDIRLTCANEYCFTKLANISVAAPLPRGSSFKESGVTFTVTSTDLTNPTVNYAKAKTGVSGAVSIPNTVQYNDFTYKVTNIGKAAFTNNTKITAVTIPANVAGIGKTAFNGCKNLKTFTIKTTKLTAANVGSVAFKGTHAKPAVKVPKAKLAAYKKLLPTKGMSKNAVYTGF